MVFGFRLFRQRLDQIDRRLAMIEQALQIQSPDKQWGLPVSRLEHSITLGPPEWETEVEPLPKSLQPGAPFVSKQVQLNERLTSYDFAVKAQLGQAALFTLAGLFVGGVATAMLDLVWYAAILIALAIGALALTVPLLDHRGLVHQVVNQSQVARQKKKPLRIEIKHKHFNLDTNQPQGQNHYRHLFLNGAIDRDDLRLMAREVTAGKSLAVNAWVGMGGWTRTKLDSFFAELERMDYASPGRGNKPRLLTRKGQALFRALAE